MKTEKELINAIQTADNYLSVKTELAELANITGFGDVWDFDDGDKFIMIIRKMEKKLNCSLEPAGKKLTVQLFEQKPLSADDEPEQVLIIRGFHSAHKITADELTDPDFPTGSINLMNADGDIIGTIILN